jgi:hypothetical protein
MRAISTLKPLTPGGGVWGEIWLKRKPKHVLSLVDDLQLNCIYYKVLLINILKFLNDSIL